MSDKAEPRPDRLRIREKVNALMPCDCITAYKARGLSGPDCPNCNHAEDMVDLIEAAETEAWRNGFLAQICDTERAMIVAQAIDERNVAREQLEAARRERDEARLELAAFYGSASEAVDLVRQMHQWMRCDLNSDGPGPSGGRKSRTEKSERALTAVCALEDEHNKLRVEVAALREALTPLLSYVEQLELLVYNHSSSGEHSVVRRAREALGVKP